MGLFANPLKPKRAPEMLPAITRRELQHLLEAHGWALWNNTQPYLEFGAKREDAGALLIGKLDGDLSWVPRDSVASTASRLHMPVVLLTCQTPKMAVIEYMIGRNCYLLRYDELPMLPSVLALLKLEHERQLEQMKASAQPVAYTSKEGDLTYSSDNVVQQLFNALLGRDAAEKDVAFYAEFLAVKHRADGVGRLTRLLTQSAEFKDRTARQAAPATAGANEVAAS